jgi:MFS family permease
MSSEIPTPPPPRGRLTVLLANAPGSVFALFVIFASFSTYFCMYAFRKPFSAAGYDGLVFLGTTIDLKTALVISQIIGYVISKVIGIKICSEVTRGRRALALVTLIGIAQLSLLLFALLPNDLKVLAIFFNGLPLGMVWGMVVWYLEGRRTSEMLLAGLSCSFIIASGVVKDVGRWLMTSVQVDQFWMPFVTGLCFLPPFLLAVWLLNQLPDPSAEDISARVERTTMNRGQRWQFIRQFLPAMLLLVITYFFLTAYRDYRDNFGVEIFEALGYGADQSLVFTRSEIWVAVGVLGTLAALNVIRDNRRGLIGAFGIMVSGVALLGGATLMLDAGRIDGMTWMILTGLGSYLAYVPYGSVLFDRLIASTRATGTAVFAIYVADAIGYGGAITVLLTKDLLATDVSRLDFFRGLTYFMAVLGTILLVGACALLLFRHEHHPGQPPVDTSA